MMIRGVAEVNVCFFVYIHLCRKTDEAVCFSVMVLLTTESHTPRVDSHANHLLCNN